MRLYWEERPSPRPFSFSKSNWEEESPCLKLDHVVSWDPLYLREGTSPLILYFLICKLGVLMSIQFYMIVVKI